MLYGKRVDRLRESMDQRWVHMVSLPGDQFKN
jgi:hypothetical protein